MSSSSPFAPHYVPPVLNDFANGSASLIASGCACYAWRVRCRRRHTSTPVPSPTATRHQHHLHYRPHPRTTNPATCQHGRRNPCKIENHNPSARTLDVRAVAWGGIVPFLFFFFSILHSCGGSQDPVLIRRYPWSYVYIHYKHKTDDGTSTFIIVITPSLFHVPYPSDRFLIRWK
jgi:hypothetical protein